MEDWQQSISKAFALLDDKLFNPTLKALQSMESFSGDDRPQMAGVRIPFRELKELGIDPAVFQVAGNSLSAYTVLLEEVLANRKLPRSFLDYGRTHRVNMSEEGITFIVSENDILKPIKRLGNKKLSDTPSRQASERIYHADLDWKTADIQRGRSEGWLYR